MAKATKPKKEKKETIIEQPVIPQEETVVPKTPAEEVPEVTTEEIIPESEPIVEEKPEAPVMIIEPEVPKEKLYEYAKAAPRT